jgi:hypothetical protein
LLVLLCILAANGCGPTPNAGLSATGVPVVQTVVVPGASHAQAVTMVPAATAAPRAQATLVPPTTVATAYPGQPGVPGLPSVPYAQDRMIVKSGEMDLLVVDTDVAIGGVSQLAIDYGGYILSGRSWYQDNFKFAQITIGVPSDQYESALARLRRLSITVLRETSSGQDVTDEYVDLDSRLRNLEVQAERLRAFMGEAQNVQEAITVSQSLSDVENQIEQIKGRMNYLGGRAAVSTITVNIEPERPTATPTMTPTNTPTPTPTLTPTATLIPAPYNPGITVDKALGTAGLIWQSLFDLAIWLLVVGGPFLLMVLVVLLVLRLRSGRRPRPAP